MDCETLSLFQRLSIVHFVRPFEISIKWMKLSSNTRLWTPVRLLFVCKSIQQAGGWKTFFQTWQKYQYKHYLGKASGISEYLLDSGDGKQTPKLPITV